MAVVAMLPGPRRSGRVAIPANSTWGLESTSRCSCKLQLRQSRGGPACCQSTKVGSACISSAPWAAAGTTGVPARIFWRCCATVSLGRNWRRTCSPTTARCCRTGKQVCEQDLGQRSVRGTGGSQSGSSRRRRGNGGPWTGQCQNCPPVAGTPSLSSTSASPRVGAGGRLRSAPLASRRGGNCGFATVAGGCWARKNWHCRACRGTGIATRRGQATLRHPGSLA